MRSLDLSILGEDINEECGTISSNEYIVNRVAEEYSYEPYSRELGKEDLKYIFNGDWDLYKK